MFKLFNTSRKQYVALDIGSQNTKLATYSPKNRSLQNIIIEKTPKGLFDSGMILDKESLIEFINQCLGKIEIEDEFSIIAGASGKGVITKKIDMAYMEEDMIQEHILFEAEQYLPYEIDELELDYVILKDIPNTLENNTPIFLVAILKELLGQYQEVFDGSLAECEILDANTLALFNIFEKNYSMDPSKNYLLIDIGYKGSNIAAVINNQVVFTRYLGCGGDFYTQKITERLGLSYEEAEDIKRNVISQDSSPEDISSLIQQEIHPLFCDELFSGYEFYLGFFPDNPVSQIYITGGGSLTPSITQAISQKFGAPTEILDPFAKLKLSDELEADRDRLQNFSSVVSGLMLRGM